MADLKLLGVNYPTVPRQRQADPVSDRLLIDTLGPTGGATGPLVISPVAAVSGSNSIFEISNGSSTVLSVAGSGLVNFLPVSSGVHPSQWASVHTYGDSALDLQPVSTFLSESSPEGVISAPPGSICHVRYPTANANDGVWTKNSGTGTAGWVRVQAGVTAHSALTGLTNDDHPQYLLADGTRTLTGNLAVSPGVTIDGRDISADATAFLAHISSTSNPHATSLANIGSGTLAQLNAAISDADVVPTTLTVTAGAGLTGGGALSSNITINAAAHVDGSIVVAADSIQVGILATDSQHGVRGGGTQHAAVTTAVNGFMLASDKLKLDGIAPGAVADHGALTGLPDDDHPQYLLIDGTREMTGSLRPNANSTLDLGYDAEVDPLWWRNAYIEHVESNSIDTSTIEVGSTATINEALMGSGSLLNPSLLFWDTGFYAPLSGQLTFAAEGADVLTMSSSGGSLTGNWLPSIDLTYNLGSGALRWNEINAGTITAESITTTTPIAHSTLGGLTGDDHTQYLLIDGTRAMTGPILMPDGTNLLPSFSFASDPDTGIYKNGTAIGWTFGGALRYTFSNTGITTTATNSNFSIGHTATRSRVTINGRMDTAAADSAFPAISFGQHAGLEFIGASLTQMLIFAEANVNQSGASTFDLIRGNVNITALGVGDQNLLNLMVGGASVFKVTNGGTADLQGRVLVGGGATATPNLSSVGDPNTGIHWSSEDQMSFILGGTARWTIAGNSLVGLGTTTTIATNSTNNDGTLRGSITTGANPAWNVTNQSNYTGTTTEQKLLKLTSTVNQIGGVGNTAGFTALEIATTETALGTGIQSMISAKGGIAGTTEVFAVRNSGQMLTGSGLITAPGWSFLADPDSGARWQSSGTFSFVSNGSDSLAISPTAVTSARVILAPDGSFSGPGFAFSAQTNTGIYRDGTSGISVSLGGTRSWAFTSSKISGMLATSGIGSQTSSAAAFQINGSITNGATPAVRIFNAFAFSAVGAGTQKLLSIDATVNQVLSSTGFTAFDIAITETPSGLGSGTQSMISAKGGSAGTTEVFAVRNDGRVLGPDGSAALPTFSALSDPDNGLWFNSGQPEFSTGGISRWRVGGDTFFGLRSGSAIQQASTNAGLRITGNVTTTAGTPSLSFTNANSFVGASGDQRGIDASFFVNHPALSTASFAGLVVDLYNSALGSGDQYLASFRVGGTTVAAVTNEIAPFDGLGGKFLASTADARAGYAFLGDATSKATGMAYDATRGLQFVHNGVEKLHLDANQVVVETFMRIQSGSLGAPGFTFEGDNNTGLHQPALEQLAIVCTGVQVLLADAASIRVASGTVATPGIRWMADSNSGIYFVTNGTWGLAAEGIDVARVKATVGGTQPQFLVVPGTSATAPSIACTSATTTGINLSVSQIDVMIGGSYSAIFQANQIMAPPGDAGEPSFSSTNDNTTGMDLPSAGEITFMGNGTSLVTMSDNDQAVYPVVDNLLGLGMVGKRWADVFAVQTTIGDLNMKDPNGGRAHLKIIEGEGTITVLDVRNGKKYRIPLVEDTLTDAEQELINSERARYPEEYGES